MASGRDNLKGLPRGVNKAAAQASAPAPASSGPTSSVPHQPGPSLTQQTLASVT